MGEWYKLIRSCDCGSGKPFESWFKDEEGKPVFKFCENCVRKKTNEYDELKNGKEKL